MQVVGKEQTECSSQRRYDSPGLGSLNKGFAVTGFWGTGFWGTRFTGNGRHAHSPELIGCCVSPLDRGAVYHGRVSFP